MPRRSSRGASWKPTRSPPPPNKVSHAPVHVGSRGIGAAIADGLAFGAGNAVAHRVVDAVIGPRTVQHEMVGSSVAAPAPTAAASSMGDDACGHQMKAFQDCVSSNVADIAKCQFYIDMLTECKRSSGSTM